MAAPAEIQLIAKLKNNYDHLTREDRVLIFNYICNTDWPLAQYEELTLSEQVASAAAPTSNENRKMRDDILSAAWSLGIDLVRYEPKQQPPASPTPPLERAHARTFSRLYDPDTGKHLQVVLDIREGKYDGQPLMEDVHAHIGPEVLQTHSRGYMQQMMSYPHGKAMPEMRQLQQDREPPYEICRCEYCRRRWPER